MIAERVVLRPRRLSAIADLACVFARANAVPLAAPTALCVAPAVAVAWLAGSGEPLAAWLSIGLVLRFSAAPLVVTCADLAVRPSASLRRAVATALRRTPALLGAVAFDLFLRCLTLGLGTAASQFSTEVVLLERGHVGAGMSRTRRLLQTAPGRAAAMLAWGLTVPVWGAIGGEFAWLALLDLWSVPHGDSELFDAGISLPAAVGAALGEAWWVVLRFLAYLDCRTRGEGWDLQLQCQALIDRHAASSARRAT